MFTTMFNINDGLSRECKNCVNERNCNNKEYFKNYKRKRNAIDPAYRIRRIISWKILKSLNDVLNTNIDSKILALPYTINELVIHLESQFDSNMSWDNYGKYWVIDHIVPHSLFNYKTVHDDLFFKCWSLINLRPFPKDLNRDKWDYVSEKWGNIELAKKLLGYEIIC